ncbi:MAG: Txe/YoeB family addiction module toxin [Acidobacteria bacterium]|nr:Txe/YoeB family addiction module toxin [Acidobacteriota bacterium]
MTWRIVYTAQAQKDAKKVAGAGLRPKVEELLTILARNPYQTPPRYEKLVGDLAGAYSRRINIQHRLVYQILDEVKVVKVLRMWAKSPNAGGPLPRSAPRWCRGPRWSPFP